MSIKNNTTSLQSLLEQANSLPEAENLDTEISIQTALIAQIQATVDSLPEADSGSGSISYDTCIVEISTNINSSVIYSTLDENNKITMAWTTDSINTHSLTVICGSYIFIPIASTLPEYNILGDAEFVETLGGYSINRTMVFKINGTSTINCYDDD